MLQVNLLDIGILLLLACFGVRGLLRGLAREIVGLVGMVLAFFLAGGFQEKIQPYIARLYDSPEWAPVIAYALIFISVLLGAALLAAILRKFMAVSFTGWLDHLLGGVMGLVKGVLLATVIFYLLYRCLPQAPVLADSACAPFFRTMMESLHNFLPATFR